MWSILSTYAVPIIGSAILAAFAKPDKNKPAIWKRVVDSVIKPTTTTTNPLPADLLKLLPGLLEQLVRKPSPVAPDEPLPHPADPKSPNDLIAYILSLLSLPNSPTTTAPTTDVELIAPVEHEDKLASLIAKANELAATNPDHDYLIEITRNGKVKVEQIPREKATDVQSK